jgi:hypothetical protein
MERSRMPIPVFVSESIRRRTLVYIYVLVLDYLLLDSCELRIGGFPCRKGRKIPQRACSRLNMHAIALLCEPLPIWRRARNLFLGR